ncbi:MAG TPA: hypothetical protein DCW44_01830 [Eubacterium sp.]|nr:hypothetical protein [Eubacterium sp.]
MSKKGINDYKNLNKVDYKKEILKSKRKNQSILLFAAVFFIALAVFSFMFPTEKTAIERTLMKYGGSLMFLGFGVLCIGASVYDRIQYNKEKDNYFSDFESMIRIANTGKTIYENEFFKIVDSVFIDKNNADNMVYLDEIYGVYDSSSSGGGQSFEEVYQLIIHTSRGIGIVKLPHVTQTEAKNIANILLGYTPNGFYGYNKAYVKKMKQKKKELDASRNLNSYEAAFADNHYIPSDDSSAYEHLVNDKINYDSNIYENNSFIKKAKLIFHDSVFASFFVAFIVAFIIFGVTSKTIIEYHINHINYDDTIEPDLDEIKEGKYIGGTIKNNFGCIESPYINKLSKNYYIIPYGDKVIFFMATNNDTVKQLDSQSFMNIHYPIIGGRDFTYTYDFVGKLKKLNKSQLEKSYDVIKNRCSFVNDLEKDVIPYYIAPDYSMSKEGYIITLITGFVSLISLIIMISTAIKINRKIKMRESGQKL